MRMLRTTLAIVLALLLVVSDGLPATADEPKPAADTAPPPGAEPAAPSVEEVRSRLEAIAADESLSDEVRAKLKQVYGEAQGSLKQAAAAREQVAALKKAADSAPARKAAAEAAAAKPIDLGLASVDAAAPVEQVDAARKEAKAALDTATRQLAELQSRIAEQRKESKTLPQTIAELEVKAEKLKTPPAADEGIDPAVATAIQTAHQAARVAAQLELDVARQKLKTYELESPVLPLEEEQLQRRVALATEAVEKLSQLSSRKKQDVIQTRIDEFRVALAAAPESRQQQAQVTSDLLERWPALVQKCQQQVGELVDTRERASAMQAEFTETEGLVEGDLATGGGLSRSVGYLLKRTRGRLPADHELAARGAEQSRLVEDAQEILARINGRLNDLPRPTVRADGREPEAAVDTLERDLLETMERDAETFLVETLIPLGVQQDTLRAQVKSFRGLINKHLLWVRSDTSLGADDLQNAGKGMWRLLQWQTLRQVATAIFKAVAARPILTILGLAGVIALIVLHGLFVKQIVRLGGSASGRGALRMQPTLEAIGFTALAAVPAWLGLWTLSTVLTSFSDTTTMGAAIGEALGTVGAIILPMEFLRQFTRRHGIAAAHFGWSNAVITPLRQAVRRSLTLGLPLVFFWRLVDFESGTEESLTAMARLAFILLMGVVAVVLGRLAHPRHGIPAAFIGGKSGAKAARLGWIWRPLVVLPPVALAGLMAYGYSYSATQLSISLHRSIWLVIFAVMLHALAVRWLVVSRKRIMLEELRQRAAARQQAEAGGAGMEVVDVNRLDVSAISQQTRRLIDAALFVGVLLGLWWIWSPVLPALGFLERVTLWEQRAPDGTVSGVVTLANLLVAVPIIALTFIAVRNAPGLLEAAVLRHLPLDTAARYAITSLASYLLAGIGLVLTAGTLGLSWSSVQWLIAGLSVGLGFGLQEIVANFICGIILLFEQPIRVGDVVTIDGVTGVVSRIRMRATTVTNWDRQEYIVPNKDLITGRVTNWTLTDSTNRLEIRVGVAYGTDSRQATALIREICAAHPDVLKDPETLITFQEFGDSTLTIVIRLFLASLDKRLPVLDDIHTAIHERFAAEGIEIAFPQLDVRITAATTAAAPAPAHPQTSPHRSDPT
jgi:potassium efflux system protein